MMWADKRTVRRGGWIDRERIVLDFAIGGQAAHTQVARSAQTESRVGVAAGSPTRYVKQQGIVPVLDGGAVEDLLARPAPTPIAVEINPSVELGAGRRAADVDGDTCVKLAYTNRAERHAVFVRAIAIGGSRWLSVVFKIAGFAQGWAACLVNGSRLRQPSWIGRRSVSEFRGPPKRQYANLVILDLAIRSCARGS